jgi:hypothetical protein
MATNSVSSMFIAIRDRASRVSKRGAGIAKDESQSCGGGSMNRKTSECLMTTARSPIEADCPEDPERTSYRCEKERQECDAGEVRNGSILL